MQRLTVGFALLARKMFSAIVSSPDLMCLKKNGTSLAVGPSKDSCTDYDQSCWFARFAPFFFMKIGRASPYVVIGLRAKAAPNQRAKG